MTESLSVEVIYALSLEADRVRLALPVGSTVQQAVEASGVLARHPEIDLAHAKLGVYGKLSRADAPLRDRDRVEIYRPLIADPKEARRKRADEGKAGKAGKVGKGEKDEAARTAE